MRVAIGLAMVVGAAALVSPWGGLGVARAAPTCDTSWLGGDGLWTDAAKWSGGVPSSSDPSKDQACIVGDGTYTVTLKGLRSAAELTLGGGSGVQTLQIQNDNVAGSGRLQLTNQGGMSAEGIRSNGVVKLAGSETGYAGLQVAGGTLVNDGSIQSIAGGATDRFLQGNLTNNGTLTIETLTYANFTGEVWVNHGTIDVRPGADLNLNVQGGSTFTQTSKGTLKLGINSAASYGRLFGDKLYLAGKLSVVRKPSYKPSVGTTFSAVYGNMRSGAFSEIVKAVVAKTQYLKPTYSFYYVELVAAEATLTAFPASGAPGAAVTLNGSGYPANDAVKVSFKDVDGTKTSLGTVTSDANGAFSVSKTVPANGDPGVGKFSAKSGVTAVTPKAVFTVT